jgi:transcription elongation factor Elf1
MPNVPRRLVTQTNHIVTCVRCASDAFAIGAIDEYPRLVHLQLRCGECGTWQRISVPPVVAERFFLAVHETRTAMAAALASAG